MTIVSDYKYKQSSATAFNLKHEEFAGKKWTSGSVLTPYGIVKVENYALVEYPFLLRFDFIHKGFHFMRSCKVKKIYNDNGLVRMARNYAKEIVDR